MANLFLFLAFLCDIVTYKNYYNPPFQIECIYIAFFLCSFRNKKQSPNLIFAFILIAIASFLNANSVGANLLFFLVSFAMYFFMVVYPKYKSLGTMYVKKPTQKLQSCILFAIIYATSLTIKTITLLMLGYEISISSTLLSFLANILFFTILSICI